MFNFKKKKIEIDEKDQFEIEYPVEDYFNQNGLVIESHEIKHANRYSRSYYLTGFPKEVSATDIVNAFDLSEKANFKSFSYYIKIHIKNTADPLLYRTIKTTKITISEQVATPIFGGSEIEAKNKVENIEDIEDQVAKGQDLTDTTVALTIFGDSIEHLNDIDKHIQTKMRQRKWVFAVPVYDQQNAFLNSLPIPTQNGLHQKVLSNPISIMMLPTSTRQSGMLPIGYDYYRKNLYFFDCFQGDRTHSICVTGDNGGGKSAWCKKFFEELGLMGVQRWYIDPEGECAKMAKAIGAKVIQVNRGAGINIVDYNEDSIQLFDEEDRMKFNPKADHINWLADFMLTFPIFDQSIHKNRTPLLDCLSMFYNTVGQDRSKRNMEELCNFLRNHTKTKDDWKYCWLGIKNFSDDERDNATYGGYFGTKDELNFSDDQAILDISGNENEVVRSALGYALLYKVFEKMLPKDRYRALFIDELHMFLKFPGFRDLLTQYVKRCRKYNGFFVLITQELNDYHKFDAIAITKQLGFQCIFAQENVHDDVLRITTEDMERIRSLPVGSCMIWQKKSNTMDKVKIHLRKYQFEYCAKDNTQEVSMDMFKRYESK
ncbi:MAG: VirB4 family type IV secretion system protein [Patescibacteria group bacterium]